MSRTFEAPKTEPDSRLGIHTESHPAYGCCVLTRWCATPAERLTGSDLKHSTGLTLSVRKAVVKGHSGTDGVFSGETIVEFDMSADQWARLVSSVGLGDGVPVTLTRIRTGDNMKLQGVPGIAPRERLTVESAADELQSWLHKRLESMRESIAAIEGMLVPGQTVSRSGLRAACINLSRNAQDLPGTASYALEEFGRKAEEASERARTEIEAHASLIAQRAGLEALSGGGMVESSRRIEGRPDDTEIG